MANEVRLCGVPQRLLVPFPRGKETRPIGRNPIKRRAGSSRPTKVRRQRSPPAAAKHLCRKPSQRPDEGIGPYRRKNNRGGGSRPRPAKKRPGQKNLRMHRRGGGNIPTPLFTRLFDLCPFAVSPSDDGSLSQTQWVRRTRPLARRRASTLRPLRVAIRLRKPCSLERWRFLG